MTNLALVSKDLDMSALTATEKATVQRALKALREPERSELESGKNIMAVRNLTERIGQFNRFIRSLPFANRTAYRRLSVYQRALEIWPEELVDLAIERRLMIVGNTPEKPMGFFEDIAPFEGVKTEGRMNEYLTKAQTSVRVGRLRKTRIAPTKRDLVIQCFRVAYQAVQALPEKDRESFLEDLVGSQMSLVGASGSMRFEAKEIEQDFWPKAVIQSAETRSRISAAATARWERIRGG